jgi:dihydrofolate reductase
MRKLILQMQMSVDGYVAGPKGERPWQVWNFSDEWTWDDALQREFNAILASVDCILLSRKMAEEGYLDHWGKMADRHAGEPRFAFARQIVDVHKVVVSKKLERSRWERTVVARGDLTVEVEALKRQSGGDIITFGGVGFGTALLRANLVDELQLFVNPTAIGAGISLFENRRTSLELVRADAYACGIVVSRYAFNANAAR